MQIDSSKDEYIRAVQSRIRWSRARRAVTRELSDHIDDRCEALRSDGWSSREAMRRAIAEMGDAGTVGAELDRIHRPKTDWPLISLTAVLLLLGLFASLFPAPASLTAPKAAGAVLGIGAAVLFYFADYTVLLRFPKQIYGILTAAVAALLLYELRNGFSTPGYRLSLYPILCYPIVLAGILFEIEENGGARRGLRYWSYAAPPLLFSLLGGSIPAFAVLLPCEGILFACGAKRSRLKRDWKGGALAACVSVGSLFTAFLLCRSRGVPSRLAAGAFTRPVPGDFGSVWNSADWIGARRPDEAVASYFCDRPLTLTAYEYGRLPALLLLILLVIFLLLLCRAFQRQSTKSGRLLIGSVLLIELFRTAGSVLADLGALPGFFLCLPFAASGGAFLTFDLSLMGIALSVIRSETIATDWIRLKLQREDFLP